MHGRAYLMIWHALRKWHVIRALMQTIEPSRYLPNIAFYIQEFQGPFCIRGKIIKLRLVQYFASEARFRFKAILIVLHLRQSIEVIKIVDSLRHQQITNKQINIYLGYHRYAYENRNPFIHVMKYVPFVIIFAICIVSIDITHWIRRVISVTICCEAAVVVLRLGWHTARETETCVWLFVFIDQNMCYSFIRILSCAVSTYTSSIPPINIHNGVWENKFKSWYKQCPVVD